MARINIEDSLFREDGFLNLIEKTGNRYSAMGMVVSAFILSQKFYVKHGHIPFKEWPEALEVLVEVKLAERTLNGIYVRGSKEAFSWLKQKSDAGSVISTLKSEQLKKARQAKKVKNEAESIERSLNGVCTDLNGSEAPTLTLTLTPTLTQDLTHKGSENKTEVLHPLIEVWNNTVRKLSKVKKSNPDRDKKIKKVWNQNTPEEWAVIIKRLDDSDFCNGINDRKWKASFDFLIKPETHLKAMEGTYDNRNGKKRFGFERDDAEVTSEFDSIARGETN